MKINQIQSMSWANAAKTSVLLMADADEGSDLKITTPYNDSSIIWDSIKDFPSDQIGDFIDRSNELSAEQNKEKASDLLSDTDWVFQPDVTDESLTPHLLNQAEFIAYRTQLRAIAVNPQDGSLDWPEKPAARWSD